MRTFDHFARPLPVDGKTPTKGDQICKYCGEDIYRAGVVMMSDGVRGTWRHLTVRQPSAKVKT